MSTEMQDRISRAEKTRDAADNSLRMWLAGEIELNLRDLRKRLKHLTGAKVFSTGFKPRTEWLAELDGVISRGNEEVLLRRSVEAILATPRSEDADVKATRRRKAATLIWVLKNPDKA